MDIARSAGEVGRLAAQRVPRLVADRGAVRSAAPGVDVDVLEACELAREVLDVDAGAAVDVGRVLAGEQREPSRLHRRALADHDDAAGRDGEALAVGLGVDADLRARRRCCTFLSMMARRTTASRPTSTPCMSDRVLDLGVGVHVRARREDRAPHDAAGDDHARADHRVERGPAAAAVLVEDELRRRQRLGPGEDRPLAVVEVEDGWTEIRSMCAS